MKKLLCIIFRLRQQKNFSQAYMAFKMGLSQKQYSFLEAGKTQLKLSDLIKIGKLLEINPCDLLEQSGLLEESVSSEKDKVIAHQSTIIDQQNIKYKYIELVNNKLLQL